MYYYATVRIAVIQQQVNSLSVFFNASPSQPAILKELDRRRRRMFDAQKPDNVVFNTGESCYAHPL